MYRLMIADDEPEILQYLETLLPWEKYGFQLVAKANNGTSALRAAPQGIDLLITDITMPGMTGLELIRLMKANNRDLKSIVLTCHEDFEFASEAIRLGVFRYFVKYLLEPEELAQALVKIRTQLDAKLQQDDINNSYENSKSLLCEKFLEDVLHANTNPNAKNRLRAQLEQLNLAPYRNARTVLISLCDWDLRRMHLPISETDLLLYALQNVTAELLPEAVFSLPYLCDRKHLILFIKDPALSDAGLAFYLDKVAQAAQKHFSLQLTIAVSAYAMDILSLVKMLNRLQFISTQNFYHKDQAVLFEDCATKNDTPLPLDLHALIQAISAEDAAQVSNAVHQQLELFSSKQTPKATVDLYYKSLAHCLDQHLHKRGISSNYSLQYADSWDYAQISIHNALDWFFENLHKGKTPPLRPEIQKVLSKINEDLSERITCAAMAELVNMNVNYFSKLFKSQTGKSFSEYLIQKRVEHATYLLQNTNDSMEQITEQVGLGDMHYFYRMYKKETGVSPGSVRRPNA